MTTRPRLSTRRHLAFMSATERDGLSSIKIWVWFRAAEAAAILVQSSSPSLPVTSFLLSTKDSLEMRRMHSCSRLISKEKNTTVLPENLPAWSSRFRAKEVLPMPGRAASRIRSDLFSPEMAMSTSGRPVDRPGTAWSLAASSLSRSYTPRITLEMWVRPWAARPCRMA